MLAVTTCAATTGRWLHAEIVDPDGWAANVADLLDDDEVAREVASIITDRVVASLVDEVLDIPFLPGGAKERAEEVIRGRVAPAVERLVRSEAASSAWRVAAERSHPQVVAAIQDDDTTFVGGRTVRLDLAPLAETLVETVSDAVSDALEFGGVSVDLTPDLDLDLRVVLVDFSDADAALDLADAAEQRRGLWSVLAVMSALALVLAGPRRLAWCAVAGGMILVGAGAFFLGVRAAEPDGLADTWAHLSATATPHAAIAGAIGVVLMLLAAGAAVATRR